MSEPVNYCFVENLPLNTTEQEVWDLFRAFGRIQCVSMLRFQTELTVYDFQAAVIKFDPSSIRTEAKIARLMEAVIVFRNHVLRTMPLGSLAQLTPTAILLDVDPCYFDARIAPFWCLNVSQFLTNYQHHLVGYVVRFANAAACTAFLEKWKDSQAHALIDSDSRVAFPKSLTPPRKTCEAADATMKKLNNFTLLSMDTRYTVYRETAAALSSKIAECKQDYLRVPPLVGPFQLIVDFLNLAEVAITPEAKKFVFIMASFLGTPELLEAARVGVDELLTLENAVATAMVVPYQQTKEAENLCQFIADNLADIVALDLGMSVHKGYASRILDLASQSETHDPLLLFLMTLEPGHASELIKCVDKQRVSKETLEEFKTYASHKSLDVKAFFES